MSRAAPRIAGALLPALVAALSLAGCAGKPARPAAAALPEPEIPVPLFSADDALEESWRKVRVWRDAEFRLVALGDAVAIAATAEGASAGLARRVEIDTATCPAVEWSWRVDAIPKEADLSVREREDVAASILFAFGDPGVFANPDPVPTLRYVWTTDANPVGQIIDSPYFPGTLKSVVVRSGEAQLGTWITERRDLIADYERAFGEPPETPVEVMALFTDSDHGRDRVRALYGWANALCTEAPAPPSIF